MTGKDILKLLLVTYGFDEVRVTTYKGMGGAQGYVIQAHNSNTGSYYDEENCEGLMFNIAYLINKMQELNITPAYDPFPGYEYSVNEILRILDR